MLCDPARIVFFKEKRVKKKATGAGMVRHGRTISPGGYRSAAEVIMRSYGPSVPSIANFFALVSENNRWYKSLSCIQRQRAAFVAPGLLQRSENAMRRR